MKYWVQVVGDYPPTEGTLYSTFAELPEEAPDPVAIAEAKAHARVRAGSATARQKRDANRDWPPEKVQREMQFWHHKHPTLTYADLVKRIVWASQTNPPTVSESTVRRHTKELRETLFQ